MKGVASAVESQIHTVFGVQAGEGGRGGDAERLACGFAELGTCQDGAVVGEADKPTVEGRIPKRG